MFISSWRLMVKVLSSLSFLGCDRGSLGVVQQCACVWAQFGGPGTLCSRRDSRELRRNESCQRRVVGVLGRETNRVIPVF